VADLHCEELRACGTQRLDHRADFAGVGLPVAGHADRRTGGAAEDHRVRHGQNWRGIEDREVEPGVEVADQAGQVLSHQEFGGGRGKGPGCEDRESLEIALGKRIIQLDRA